MSLHEDAGSDGAAEGVEAGKKEEVYMPGRDGTGPWGDGPMTGRGFGYCSGSGRGIHSWGFRRRRFWPVNRGNMFSEEMRAMEEEISKLRKRIEELEKGEK